MSGLSVAQLRFFAILAAAFALLSTERVRNDVVAMLMVLALAAGGLLKPAEALSGFSTESALLAACTAACTRRSSPAAAAPARRRRFFRLDTGPQ